MDRLRIRFLGRKDQRGNPYFFTTCTAPVAVDLKDCVMHFFVDQDRKGGELVVRHFTRGHDTVDEQDVDTPAQPR